MKWIFHYLAGSTNFGIMFDHDGARGDVSGFVDSNYAGDLDSRRSTSGYILTFCGGPICWKSVLQSTTTLSTTDGEYMALTEVAKEALWLKGLVEELGFMQHGSGNGLILDRLYCTRFTLMTTQLICSRRQSQQSSSIASAYYIFFLAEFKVECIPTFKGMQGRISEEEVFCGDIGDFEFRLKDSVNVLPVEELFSDGKLMPLHLSMIRPMERMTASSQISLPDMSKSLQITIISSSDPYLFQPKAPR
ncbi:hypothetical protein RJ639_031320 [Escallonia herrerae]|uniref:Retrovirus-related Pol polyprotein from transposon TNT 1-94 n=1 Tax=Escallonia herrerae TaxID=1293975 RepID=A0AA89BHN4_9ASTE|nr:hypothetical protein RJ639_031320 [Escallonia herrerae]